MATGVASWSKTAATNASADSAVNFAEGQAPSSLNDSNRAAMASTKKWYDDIMGTLTTGGTSTAYTITTNQVFGSLAALSGSTICIIPHTTSGAAPTLAVDGLSAKAINSATTVAVPTGALVAGTPYLVTYINASTEFILVGQAGTLTSAQITALTAAQSDLETATSNVLFVTPGRVRFNPGVSKAWVDYTYSGGTPTVNGSASLNIASLTDNAQGDVTFNFTTSFSAANYCFQGASMPNSTAVGLLVAPFTTAKGTGSCRAVAVTNVFAAADNGFNHAAFWGDQ